MSERETVDRLDFVVCCLASIRQETPHGLAIRMGIPLSSLYARLARLSLTGLCHKAVVQKNVVYTSYLTSTEMRKGLVKWVELSILYPEIIELIARREANGDKNNSSCEGDTERLEYLDTKGGV